jgi:serine/threonine protein phosphatase PrpC
MGKLSDSIRFYAATDVGKVRDHNEDNFLVDKKLALFIVADGMGGHAAGEVASAMAVRTVHE